jgi:hypothetical protein
VLRTFAANCGPRLCGQKQGITHGNSNVFVAEVESHNSHIFMIQPMSHGL